MKILVINGPNLNLLGKRDPAVYGTETLAGLTERMNSFAAKNGVRLEFFQSNSEGQILDRLQAAEGIDGVVLNPGGLTHTSVSLRDCIEGVGIPVIEVHISNIFAREEFRRTSVVSAVCRGVISGLGCDGYLLALQHFIFAGAKGA